MPNGETVEDVALKIVELGKDEFFSSGMEWPNFVSNFEAKVVFSPEASEADEVMIQIIEETGMHLATGTREMIEDFSGYVMDLIKKSVI